MDTRMLLIGAVAIALLAAGCIHDGGDVGNDSIDDGENASEMEEDEEHDDRTTNDAPTTKPSVNETYGDCPAGETKPIAEVPEPADIQGAMKKADITTTGGEVGGSVSFVGMENHDGHESCHVVVRFDEPLETTAMPIARIEIWRAADYYDMVFYDTDDTKRLHVTRDGNESTVTRYDEQGDETTGSN